MLYWHCDFAGLYIELNCINALLSQMFDVIVNVYFTWPAIPCTKLCSTSSFGNYTLLLLLLYFMKKSELGTQYKSNYAHLTIYKARRYRYIYICYHFTDTSASNLTRCYAKSVKDIQLKLF